MMAHSHGSSVGWSDGCSVGCLVGCLVGMAAGNSVNVVWLVESKEMQTSCRCATTLAAKVRFTHTHSHTTHMQMCLYARIGAANIMPKIVVASEKLSHTHTHTPIFSTPALERYMHKCARVSV